LYCEYCGKKTNKTDVLQEAIVNLEIARKSIDEQKFNEHLMKQSSKIERVPVHVTLINKEPEVDPKATLRKARAAIQAENAKIEELGASRHASGKMRGQKLQSNMSVMSPSPTDIHTGKMASFLEEYNQSEILKSNAKIAKSKGDNMSFKNQKPRKPKCQSRGDKSNAAVPDFFKSELDVKTSQNFNNITQNESYLNEIPSLLEIFDDPSLLPPEEKEEVGRTAAAPLPVDNTNLETESDHDVEGNSVNVEPKVYFWGKVLDSDEQKEEEHQEEKQEKEEEMSSLQKAVSEMKLFKGGFWGDQTGTESEDREKSEEQKKRDQDEIDALLSEDDLDEQHGGDGQSQASGGGSNGQSDEWDEQSMVSFHQSDSMEMAEIFDQLKVNMTSFNTENGRRHIAKLYRTSMKHMNFAIERGTIVFSHDPIAQSRPVSLYKRLGRRLHNVIMEAELTVKAIDELYRLCHENAKKRRLDIVARLETENKRAAQVRHKYSVKYAKITNKEDIDIYTLELAQNRIREKAEKELDAIRITVNDLLKEETDLIMKIKSEERSLELTIVMYSTKHLRLLEQIRVTHQSVVSATRWLAVRVIQRNARFYLLPASMFRLTHVGTPWFRQLIRQQAEMLRQQELAEIAASPQRRGRKRK